MNGTYDANNNAWYEEYRALEQTLGNLDNILSAFGGAGFHSISEKVDRLWDAFAALAFCRENLEYELFVEIDEKLMKQFGEMTDEFATLDVRNIRTPNVLGIKGINVGYDAEGRAVSETVGGEVNYLTLENFTGAAGFDRIPGYKEQCITRFSKMLENQYDYYVEEGILDRSVKLWEYLDGMMPREFEYSQYTEVWKKIAHSFLDVLVVPTMVEAVTGVEFITGGHLTDNEQAGKAVQSLIQAVSIGITAGGAYSKGLTYVTAGKMQKSQIAKYAACKVMKSVAEDGVMNMVTTELTERDCGLAAKVLMFASMYVGMREAPDFIDRYVENGGLVKSNGGLIADAGGMKAKAAVGDMRVLKSKGGLNSKLLDELANSGVKYNPEDIVSITKTADGKLVWLENGTDTAGLNHIIIEHADDFLNKGITQEQIPDYIMNALENGKIVGYQGRGTGRPIYEFIYNGELHNVAITVGNNGFVVGANPK